MKEFIARRTWGQQANLIDAVIRKCVNAHKRSIGTPRPGPTGPEREINAGAPARYFPLQNCDFVCGGLAVSSMAQNGIDQTKSAARATRMRFGCPTTG